jgi:pyrimidine-nucleoside phosphorylase
VNAVRIIEGIREGAKLPPGSLRSFMDGYLEGKVEEYQMSAFLMAVVFRGLSDDELSELVSVMLHSGAVLDLSHLAAPRVDKHSTGGVGDKVSLVLAPLAAECGLAVPMMSGRGLGHTGGTLDKLEAIPGFRTDLSLSEFQEGLEADGLAMIGQTRDIAPLDRRLYELRSVTGTVASIPLIAASIMSKKLAEGLNGLVLDVKVGSGAFLPREADALELARTMVAIGAAHGVATRARLTAMDRPLGRTVGNAVEVQEAVECLQGGGPHDLRTVVIELVAEMIAAVDSAASPPDAQGAAGDLESGRARARAALDSGGALERFRRVVERQGGDPRGIDDPRRLPQAPIRREVPSPRSGFVHSVEPVPLGRAVVEMGGGRTRLGQQIDPAVGFSGLVQPGDTVEEGAPLVTVHAASSSDFQAALAVIRDSVSVSEESGPAPLPLLGRRILPGSV